MPLALAAIGLYAIELGVFDLCVVGMLGACSARLVLGCGNTQRAQA